MTTSTDARIEAAKEKIKAEAHRWVLSNDYGQPISFNGVLVVGNWATYWGDGARRLLQFVEQGGFQPGTHSADYGISLNGDSLFRTNGGKLILHYVAQHGIQNVSGPRYNVIVDVGGWTDTMLASHMVNRPSAEMRRAIFGSTTKHIN